MRKTLIALCAVAFVIAAVTWQRVASNPLRAPIPEIRAFVERQTPLGSSYAQVIDAVKKAKWDSPRAEGVFGRTEKGVQGLLGEYQGFPFVTWVFVRWEFDADLRLREIRVLKVSDAL